MYKPIDLTFKPDSAKALLESFDLNPIAQASVIDPVASLYTEAVFTDGKKSVEPVLKNLANIKNLLDEEIEKQEQSEKRDGKNAEKFNPKNYWRHKYFKDLEDAFTKVFGFRSVQIQPYIEKYNSSDKTFESHEINMMTYNSNRYPIDGLVTDKGFFDKTHSINIEIYVTLGLIKLLTPDELMAVVLHEFGHNIDPALVDIQYAKVNILSKYLTDRKDKLNNVEQKVIENNTKSKKGFFPIIIGMILLAVGVKKFVTWVYEKIIGTKKVEEQELNKVKKLMDEKDKEEFTRQNYSEAFADNFARMYGYGPQLAAAFKKMSKDRDDWINSRFKKERARQKCIMAIVSATLSDEHKTDIHRIRNLINEYHKDINDPNTPAIVKKQLQEDVEELEKILDAYMNDFSDFQNKVNRVIKEELDKMYPNDSNNKQDDQKNEETKDNSKEQAIKEGYEFFDESKKAYDALMK